MVCPFRRQHMMICGVDPGKSGGLSIIENNNLIAFIVMPTYENDKGKDVVDFVQVGRFLKKYQPSLVYIEFVHAMPLQGVSSCFTFGFSTGGIHGVCGAYEIPVKIVPPREWQKTLMGDEKHEKIDTINYVKNKFPDVSLLATKRSKKDHDGLADAIAIAIYGYNKETNAENKME